MDRTDFNEAFSQLAATGAGEETATMGGTDVRMVRAAGSGPGRWDRHMPTAKTVLVWSGDFRVEFRDRTLVLSAGQCVVPPNKEQRGTSKGGAEVVLFTEAP